MSTAGGIIMTGATATMLTKKRVGSLRGPSPSGLAAALRGGELMR